MTHAGVKPFNDDNKMTEVETGREQNNVLNNKQYVC